MKDWKMIAVIASLAFLFSFISGLIGSVSFGILLIRAIFGTVIFAGIGYGISILLRKFLPEIFETNADTVVVSEDNLSQKQEESNNLADNSNSAEGKPLVDISIGDEKEDFEVGKVPSVSSDSETDAENAMVDEITESKADMDVTGEDNNVPSNIDALPDMGAFSNSFDSVDDIEGSGTTGAVTLDIMGEEHDPELVAKALRTMVKKDQEG